MSSYQCQIIGVAAQHDRQDQLAGHLTVCLSEPAARDVQPRLNDRLAVIVKVVSNVEQFGRADRYADRYKGSSMTAEPLCKLIEIPDNSLNEKLVPANDNHELITLGRERLEAESVLAPHDHAKSAISPSQAPKHRFRDPAQSR